MKNLILLIVLLTPTICFADTVQVDSSVASQTISDTVDVINKDVALINQLNGSIASDTASMAEHQNQLNDAQSDLDMKRQMLTTVATQNPPIQEAVNLLNAHPEYGVNWTTTN